MTNMAKRSKEHFDSCILPCVNKHKRTHEYMGEDYYYGDDYYDEGVW